MKKIFLIVFLLCGCSKEITCTLNGEYDTQVKIIYNKNRVINVSANLDFKSNEDAENYCTLLKLSEPHLKFLCTKNVINIHDFKAYMNISANKKNDILNELTTQGFVCE